MSAPFCRTGIERAEHLPQQARVILAERASILSVQALRHLELALAPDHVTSDALLLLADMAEAAAKDIVYPLNRLSFSNLAAVLRELAPHFADTPLPPPQQHALPSRALRAAAAAIRAHGTAEALSVVPLLESMADAQEGTRP